MQTQILVQPPFLALPNTLPRVLRHHLSDLSHFTHSLIMEKSAHPVAQSGPSYSHALFDDQAPTGPRNQTPLSSPQQHPISASNQSRPTPHLPPLPPRPLSPLVSAHRPSTETQSSPHFSPSPPPQSRPMPLFPPPYSAPHHQTYFASSETSYSPLIDRYSITNLASTDRHLRAADKYPHNQHPLLDQRRMSEPTMYGKAPSGHPSNAANLSNARHHQLQHQYSYAPPQSYGSHSSPLRPPFLGGSSWKEDHHPPSHPGSIELEEPLSPLNPTFSGGESPPPMGMSEITFGSLYEDYGPSPPGTGTSTTSSNVPLTYGTGEPGSASNSKQYSFVSLPGNAVKKRPRRRYDEIERLYQCSWQDCAKAYGTLNHLNAHITMQKHGPKRSPNEFKDLRKQWRKAKKEEAEAKALEAARHDSHQIHHPSHYQTSPPGPSMSNAEYQTQSIYAHHAPRSTQSMGHLDDLRDSVTHQQDVYDRRSQRYGPLISPPQQHSGVAYPHAHAHGVSTSMNRLPTNSTLLTPLPGYGPSSIGGAPGFDAYDPYRSDGRSRTSQGSPDRGRTRSSHLNMTGRVRDGP